MNFQLIFEELKQHQDVELAKQMSAYMKDKFVFLGVKKPLRDKICKPHFNAAKLLPIDWQFIADCWNANYREMQYVATDYLRFNKKKLCPEDIPQLCSLIKCKSWWDTVDSLDQTIGEISFNYPETKSILLEWSKSENFWLRRIAIDHQLLRKEKTDVPLLEEILINNLEQTEFFINKAMGWALRDFSKTNPDWVSRFIDRYKNRMSKLTIREASKYLKSEQ